MKQVRRYQFEITTNSAGAGTVTSAYPLSGLVEEIRCENASFLGSTAILQLTRQQGGGTIFRAASIAAPIDHLPRAQISTWGGTLIAAAYDSIAVDDYVELTVSQAGTALAGTVSFYYSGL